MTSYSANNDPNYATYEYDADADDDEAATATTHQKICKITDNSLPSNSRKKKTSSSDQANAATQDARLKQFLQNADEIENIAHFVYWKDEFLKQFRQYLNPDGTATAREADEQLYFHLETLATSCMTVKQLVHTAISPERCSVKGQKAINEMTASLAKVEERIGNYWPKTQEEETQMGYTKFELAAVLVRDGFRVYGLMVATRDYVDALDSGALKDVLKPNQRSIIHYYFRCLDSFAQCMADLGMFKLMQQCVEIYKIRPRQKKKKRYSRASDGDALSDSSMSDDANKGRMFSKAKQKTKAVIDNGWTSGTTRTEVRKPRDKSGDHGNDKKNKNKGDLSDDSSEDDSDDEYGNNKKQVKDDDEEEEEDVDYLYYFDPVNEVVAKVPRAACLAERLILTTDDTTGQETYEGQVDAWDSNKDENKMGKTELIWKLKELLRGKANTKAEGLVSPPSSPKKKVKATMG